MAYGSNSCSVVLTNTKQDTNDSGATLQEKRYDNQIIVLDTNILINDPEAVSKFPGADIYVHVAVLSELDRQKEDKSRPELQFRARSAARFMRGLAEKNKGSLADAIPVGDNSRLHFFREPLAEFVPEGFDPNKNDNLIVATALALKAKNPDKQVVFVSNDLNPSHLANIFGVKTLDLSRPQPTSEELFSGVIEKDVTADVVKKFRKEGQIAIDGEFSPNQYVVLNVRNSAGELTDSLATRFDGKTKSLLPLTPLSNFNLPISPRNVEQEMALDLLLNPDIKLITLVGGAGTGKTLLAMAAGLYQALWSENPVYESVTVSRPTVVVGEEQGFLPGNEKQKVMPYLQPYFDNLEFLIGSINESDWKNRKTEANEKSPKNAEQIMNSKKVEIVNLAFIRGRSLPKRFIIIDEAQNLTAHEIKTIVTRAGEGTKIVLIGDVGQIDNKALSSRTNGLALVVNLFRNETIAGHMTLVKGERSELAATATRLFEQND